MKSARVALLAAVVALAGCNPGMNAVVRTLHDAALGDDAAAAARLDPSFRYLRVGVPGGTALLALGYVEPHPDGTVEVWYSAEREVLRLRNGRLAGATGLPTEWRGVSFPDLPAWRALARAEAPFRWTRVRDLMPGYRFGVRDVLAVRVIEPPRRSALVGRDPAALTWFEERLESSDADGDPGLPPARYAVELAQGGEVVVYGEQCLAADLCFTWQRWPNPAAR
jgi:group 4 capsule polysaccharide lipoprotein GfcB/YjbF